MDTTDTDIVETFRIEIRFDHTGTRAEALARAADVAASVGGEVTEICDENWNSVEG